MAAHSLNPAVNIVRYLHADQSHRQSGGWKLHYIEGVSRSRGERASESEGGQGKAMPGLAHFSPPCIYIRTNDRTNERASERARSPYIISLSSTLYMRSRSIFCLFAPLNAGRSDLIQ